MKKIVVIFIACSFLLVGCWDERLFKELAIVPLIGVEGELGDLTGYYTFLAVSDGSISYSTVEGSGPSVRDSRLVANTKANEVLDVSQLEVILIAEETAKSDVIGTFNTIYRLPRNRLGGRFAIVEGKMAQYMEKSENMPVELPDFYRKLLQSPIDYSTLPDIDIQKAAELNFDDGIDLMLPFIKMSEKTSTPEVSGIALFSDKVYTGHTLNVEESTIIQTLQKNTGRFTMFTYTWEKDDKLYPITVKLSSYKKKWDIKDSKIDTIYKMKFDVDEFSHDHLDEDKTREELEKFLAKELTKDFNKVIKKIQEAKSDAVGFGRTVRAFHPHLWNKGNWQDTFSELDISVKVEVEIRRTGVLN